MRTNPIWLGEIKRKPEIYFIILLQILFALCALSVLAYRMLGIAFDFPYLSYRVFNILLSVLLVIYFTYALLQSHRNTLRYITVFSLFHVVEGFVIAFWYKVIIQSLTLVTLIVYYYGHKTLALAHEQGGDTHG